MRSSPAQRYATSMPARPFASLHGLATEQNNPNLYDYLGSAQIERGDARSQPEERAWFYRLALDAFKNGRRLAPLDEGFALQLGFTYDLLGRFAEGEWMYDEALRLDPKSVSTQQYYARHLERWRTNGGPTPTATPPEKKEGAK